MEKCLVTKIVKDSILDGPGCRYVVFVKGCHLKCFWCHNPEARSPKQEILRYPKFCIQCGSCVKVAPAGTPKDILPVQIDSTQMDQFLPCVEACPTEALEYAGKEYGTDTLITDMLKYRTVYSRTQGGLTISGGEPLLQDAFSLELFEKARSHGLHTAVDTSGTLPWSTLERFLPVVDLWLYDFKHIADPEVQSDLAIENLKRLAGLEVTHLWIRIPLIPDHNDSPTVLQAMAQTLKALGPAIERVDLLPFHPYGGAKYEALGMSYALKDRKALDQAAGQKAKDIFENYIDSQRIQIGRKILHG